MTRISNLLDVLKVEVEQPTSLLKNLLGNPSGELGAWAWATPVGLLATGTDTFTNPGFEVDTSGWDTAASFLNNAGATLTRITTDHDSGLASAEVVTTAASNQQGIGTSITLPPNTTATISARVKRVAGRPVLLRSRDVTNSVSGSTGTSGPAGGGWETLTTTITTGAASATVRVAITTDTTAGVSTFRVDSLLSSVVGKYLEYRTAAGGPVGGVLLSESFPVTPGQYVGASWDAISFDASLAVSAAIKFYNVSGAEISQLPAAPAYAAVTGRLVVAAQLIPAGAVTGRLSFGVSNGLGGGVLAGKRFRFRYAVVATATTAAAIGPLYTNLVKDPSFEDGHTTSWFSQSSATFYPVTVGGIKKARIDPAGTFPARGWVRAETPVTVTPGKTYRIGFEHVGTLHAYGVDWYTAAGAPPVDPGVGVGAGLISTIGGTAWASDDTSLYARNVVAPAGAAFGRLWIEHKLTGGATATIDVDKVLFTDDDTLPATYWDGATPDVAGSIDYGWTGAANVTTSTKSLSKLPYIPPITYQEVQGSAVTLGLTQRLFDCTLSATIKDAALDPATANLIRPGRAVRVRVKNPLGAWVPFFQGKAARPSVDYGDLKRGERPTITLTAYGSGADLTSAPAPNSVGTIVDLATVLEGIRVPFILDTVTDQAPAVAAVATNDSATALDQIILTRDTVHGYAWVDRQGVLRAYTSRNADYYSTGYANFVEDDYTALGLSYDPATIINVVSVIQLRYNPSTGETEEVTYGPYIDYASFRDWGPSPAEYRILPGIDPAVWAASVLAANSQGTQRIEGLRVPITDTEDLTPTKALVDLYALATVRNDNRGIFTEQRVEGITHTITWSAKRGPRWFMDLLFQGTDDAAAPMSVTPVEGTSLKDGVWYEVGSAGQPAFQNSWVAFGGSVGTPAFMRKDGIVYLKGVTKNGTAGLIFTLPVGFRPGATKVLPSVATTVTSGAASTGTAHTHAMSSIAARVSITALGAVSQDTGTNASCSLDGICYPAEG